MYQLRFPGKPPTANERKKAASIPGAKGGRGRLYTSSESKAYQQEVSLRATAAMRQLGLSEPLSGALAAVYFFRLQRGRRDWDSSVKDVQDALNGIVWKDDKQLVIGVGIVDRRAEKDEVVVYVAPAHKADRLLTLASTLLASIEAPSDD